MNLVPQILAAYTEIENYLFGELDKALNSNDPHRQAAIQDFRRFNDNEYFVLLWGQLENEINTKFTAVITTGQAHPDWIERRKFYNYNLDKTKFEERLSLLLDKQAGKGSEWALAMRYDEHRNKIAHGESNRTGIDVTAVIAALYQVQSALTV
ncbi:hypothetical protein MKK75_05335 [Methylobacterium sp. J-030]|uniref:hypothetical protein n=1 Tax=Methylobacterium sp. J-030 TaxID=2836627 RepID=UPI001FB9CCB7|nr:hypothetical protein [Methylobacterium sp. J-030]MCJ2068238.1 hypothetical protein [Methylobacterium sp. J-030]